MKAVKINDQIWMSENLNVSTFSNGDPIPHVETSEDWAKAGEEGKPACCFYNNDPENGEKYGRLYNWYAITDPRGIAPEGWRVPTKEDWEKLLIYLENDSTDEACTKVKSKTGWPKDQNGENQTGFTALPGGYRFGDGSFEEGGKMAYWWTSTDNPSFNRFPAAWFVLIRGYGFQVELEFEDKAQGFSIRCIK